MARKILIDTGVIIDFERSGIDLGIRDDDDVALAAITIAEFQVGVERASDIALAERRQRVLNAILENVSVLPYTTQTAFVHAKLLAFAAAQGAKRGAHDLIIAAHAAQSGRTLITRDVKARFGELPGVAVGD